METTEKLKPLTNKEKKYIWRTFIEIHIQNGYNVEEFLFNPPRLKYMNCNYIIDEIIKQDDIFHGDNEDFYINTNKSAKEWELLKNRYNQNRFNQNK